MREIKFRGKRKDNGEWVYGSLTVENAYDLNDGTHKPQPLRTFIVNQDIEWFPEPHNKRWAHTRREVIPETIGQFTGLHDKNGKEIWEGDIICSGKLILCVYWQQESVDIEDDFLGGFWATREIGIGIISPLSIWALKVQFEVIGNKHDTPELLK